ncbi:hypothetical protein G4B88_015456 [Cannabis sativa]|nr:hypothetical protein G4B88_015456 [Cannabis sativa]
MESIRSKAPSLRTVADLMYRSTRKLNMGYLRHLFGCDMGNKIGMIQIDMNATSDFLIWKESLVGNFSVKGAYWIDQKERFGEKDELWSWIWNSKVHPRMSLMLWRVCSSVLPTGDKFLPLEANTFPICHMAAESAIHLFAKSSFATALWFSSPMPIRIDRVAGANMREVIHNLCSSFDSSLRPKLLNCIGVILDCIWNTRNKVYHSVDYMPNVNLIRGEVSSRVSELCQVVEANLSLSNNHEGETSPRISTNTFIMVDGSFKDGTYGCAMVALDKGYREWWQCTSSVSYDAQRFVDVDCNPNAKVITPYTNKVLRIRFDECSHIIPSMFNHPFRHKTILQIMKLNPHINLMQRNHSRILPSFQTMKHKRHSVKRPRTPIDNLTYQPSTIDRQMLEHPLPDHQKSELPLLLPQYPGVHIDPSSHHLDDYLKP